jgi:LCP family protein required for cell wall assembly
MTVIPNEPYIGMLSIPRDLWVTIPGIGENRINTAHFFAEAQEDGTGPMAVVETIQHNFGVDVHYYVRLHHLGFQEVIDELDGIDVNLPASLFGYEPGSYHFNGEQALAFVRDRAGSDDFSRMERGQIILSALIKRLASPSSWLEFPRIWKTISESMDTNVPLWKVPSMMLTVLRVGTNDIDSRIISRDMVIPFTTDAGASVLAPNWDQINPILLEIFGQ